MDKIYDFLNKYTGFQPETAMKYIAIALKILVIFIVSRLLIYILNKVVEKVFRLHPKLKMDEKKESTLIGILKSVIKYSIYIIMGISILEAMNIPTQPLLATAGLGGLAIGFGAQSLVRDVFSGFFILFEDQFSVGDFVTIGGITGTVEDMGLRITKIRSFKGELNVIPNGEIKIVTNLSRGNSLAIVDVSIAYETDSERALKVLSEAAEEFYKNNEERVVEEPQVQGITNLGEFDIVLRTIIKTAPLKHWEVERDFRKTVLTAFKKNDIEIPYPKRVIIDKK
ncbi:MAG: mechanosensitive ion channel family protein [Bacillota bacterium]